MEAERFEREVSTGQGITKTFEIKITLYSVNILTRKKVSDQSVYGPNTRAYVVGLTAKEKTKNFSKLEYKLMPSEEDFRFSTRVYLRYKENLLVNKEVYIKEVNKLLQKIDEIIQDLSEEVFEETIEEIPA